MIIRTMILKQILFPLVSLTLFAGCNSDKAPDIRTLCLRDGIGNYVIKWETEPHINGVMKLYVSDNPESFNMSNPVMYSNIDKGITTFITNNNITRKYFLLAFNDKYYQTVGSRSVSMDGVQNLRDIGGYLTPNKNKATRWGKVFRSGQLGVLSNLDTMRLNNLGIKTIIDLRGEDEVAATPEKYGNAKLISIPIPLQKKDILSKRIEEGRIRKGDAMLYMQDTYLRYVNHDNEQFGKALKVFLDKDNYPILINCSMGKDRTGFLTAMLLAAVGIPEETIKKDYVSSNNYINISHLAYMARNLSQDSQEAITVLVTVNEGLMDLVFNQIKKEYGSTDKFLSKGLDLSEKERDTLKDILLY